MTTVPNQQPRVDPGTTRLAVVGECPGIEESTCQWCSRGHRFALQYWEEKRLQTRDRCPVPECCSREFTADPTPFVGWSGRLLDDVLAEAGLPRERVFVGNVAQVTQTAAELADPLNPHVVADLAVLRTDLATFRPNIVLCLGNTALRAFHSDAKASVTNWRGSLWASTFLDGALPSIIHPDAIRPVPPAPPGPLQPGVASPLSGGTHSDIPVGPSFAPPVAVTACPPVLLGTAAAASGDSPLPLTDGSTPSGAIVLGCPAPVVGESAEVPAVRPPGVPVAAKLTNEKPGVSSVQRNDRGNSTYVPVPLKCTASYHPRDVLRTPGWTALLRFDVARAVKEAATPVLPLPERVFEWTLTADEIIERLATIRTARQLIGTDLEGYATSGVTDLSFAITPWHVVWVPFKTIDKAPWWPPITEQRLWTAVRGVMEDVEVPKVCHAGTYEGFVLQWAHGITLRGLVDDTMLMWHELFPELDKGLETPVSILTRQPYWGTSRDASTEEERAIYNCTDSAVTLEIADVMRPMLV